MIELDDCSKEFHLTFDKIGASTTYPWEADVRVQMVIKAPRGTIALFGELKTSMSNIAIQCKGIKAFMEGHKDD